MLKLNLYDTKDYKSVCGKLTFKACKEYTFALLALIRLVMCLCAQLTSITGNWKQRRHRVSEWINFGTMFSGKRSLTFKSVCWHDISKFNPIV